MINSVHTTCLLKLPGPILCSSKHPLLIAANRPFRCTYRCPCKAVASSDHISNNDCTSPAPELTTKPRRPPPQQPVHRHIQQQPSQDRNQAPPIVPQGNISDHPKAVSQNANEWREQQPDGRHSSTDTAHKADGSHGWHQRGTSSGAAATEAADKSYRQHQKGTPASTHTAQRGTSQYSNHQKGSITGSAAPHQPSSRFGRHPKATDAHTGAVRKGWQEQKTNRRPFAQPEAAADRPANSAMPHPGQITSFIVSAASAAEILRLYADLKQGFNAINLATAVHRIAKHSKFLSLEQRQSICDHPGTKALAGAMMARLSECNSQSLANLAWAQAVVSLGPAEFLPQVLHQVSCMLHKDEEGMKDKELSIICWAAAKQGCLSPAVWSQLSPLLCTRLSRFNPQMLSNVVWACATMGFADDTAFIHAAAKAAIQLQEQLLAQSLANIAWAFAKLRYYDTKLFDAFARQTLALANRLTDKDVAHLTWAICHALAAQAAAEGTDVLHQNQNTTFARSFLSQQGRAKLLSVLRHQAISLLRSRRISVVTIATCVSSFASIGYYSPELYERAAEQVVQSVMQADLQALVTTAHAYSTQRHYHPGLMTAIAQRGLVMLEDPNINFEPLAIATLAISYATHTAEEDDQVCGDFMAALADRALETLETFETQALANTAWGLAVWGHLSVPFFHKLRSLSPSLMSQFRPEELQQLYQVELILRLEAPHLGLDVSHIQQYEALFAALQERGQLTQAAQARWRHHMGPAGITTSAYQQDVAAALTGLPLNYGVEVEYMQAEYTVDMALPEVRLAVEADGPLHFMRNVPRATGRTLVKRRSLQKMGWTVLSVPYFHWQALTDPHIKQVYMHKRLMQLDILARLPPVLDMAADNTSDGPSLSDADMQTVDMLVAESAHLGLLEMPAEEWRTKHAAEQARMQQSDSRRLTADEVRRLKQSAVSQQKHQLLQQKAGRGKLSRHELLLKIAQDRRKKIL